MRTSANMRNRKRILTLMGNQPGRGQKAKALKTAKRLGVNMQVPNAFDDDSDASVSERVLGPDRAKDNVHQNTPQVTLHGMDEGLSNKTNAGVLEACIKEAGYNWGISATEVKSTYVCPSRPNVHSNDRSDVHYNDHYNIHFKNVLHNVHF